MIQRRSLTKVFLALAAVSATVGAATVLTSRDAEAVTQAPPSTRIKCNGRSCGGTGPREYRYEVTPSATGVTRVDIGLHDAGITLSNVIVPTGWTAQIMTGNAADEASAPAHGTVGPLPTGACPAFVRFASSTGPALTTPFVLAYNCARSPHTTSWVTDDSSAGDWSRPLGNGTGVVHAPH